MKKNNQSPKKNTAAKAPRRARKSARSVKDPRWSFELGATEWGPFKTKGAKINSARSMVGLGERAIDIQRKMPRLRTTINENGNTVDLLTGTDFITSIVSGPTSAPGDILYKQEISPSRLANTRLLQFSQLYQRYRFKRISFIYEPVASATQSGQLLGFADFDVDNQINTNSTENLAIGAAHQGQAITQIWQPIEFDMGQVLTFTDLFTEVGSSVTDDQRMSIQGVFYLLAASALPETLSLGNVYVDYEIEFSIPYLSIASTQIEKRSAGHLWAGATLPSAGNVITLNNEETIAGFGPVKAVVEDGQRTLKFEGCRSGDQIWCTFTFITSASTGLDTLPAGTTSHGALVSTSPIIEGGNLETAHRNQWRNAHVTNATQFAGWGTVGVLVNVDSAQGTYIDVLSPAWTENTGGDHPTAPQFVEITWFVIPSATVAKMRREKYQKGIRDAPQELEEMRLMMRKLSMQLAIVRNSTRTQNEAKDKEKAADDDLEYEQRSSVGTSSASPSVPRSASPNIVLTPGQRPRSSSLLARSVSPRVSDEIAHYGSDKESW